VAELLGGSLKAVGKEALVIAVALALLNTVAAIVECERHHRAEASGDADRHLEALNQELALPEVRWGRGEAEQQREQ
jgi:hypothetical protein